jgi:hypothetical protein
MNTLKFYCFAMLGAALLAPASVSAASVESAQAQHTPWSGYWWPMHRGGVQTPLSKYDQITGLDALSWERQNRPSGPQVPHWFGFCHAWSASSIMEEEPKQPRAVPTVNNQTCNVGVGDQKGMFAASHNQDLANSFGDRFGDGAGSEDPNDIAPDVLWRVLKTYIKEQGIPIVCDVEAGPEVWNYPVYAYQVSYEETGGGQYLCQMSLLMAEDAVPPDYVGTHVRRQTYQFTCQIRNGAVVVGSGRWVGASVKDHPDFAWHPYLAKSDNPQVTRERVVKIVGGSNQTPTTPNTPTTPTEPTTPTTPTTTTTPGTTPTTPGTAPSTPTTPGTTPNAPTTPATPETTPTTPATPGTTPTVPTTPGTTQSQVTQTGELAISPMELVALIAEKTSSFGLDVTVDRFDGARYENGSTFSIRGASAQAGYLYLLHIDSQGELTLLYPLAGQDNRVPAGRSFEIPGPTDRFAFRAIAPPGVNRVKALVTTRPLVLTGLLAVQAQTVQQQAAGQQQTAPRQKFRWHPTQRAQIQQLLVQYQRQNALSAQMLGVDPRNVLGPFAQDEVAFYVEPAAGQPGGQSQQGQQGQQRY